MNRTLNRRVAMNSRTLPRTGRLPGVILALILCAMVCALGSPRAGAEDTTEALSPSGRLNAFLEEVTTLEVNFKQTMIDERGKVLENSVGIAYLKRPRQFRWEYQDPYRQTIVSDGERVWFHDHELAQVIVKPWDAFATDATPAAILTMNRPLTEMFRIEELRSEEKDAVWEWVKLTPKSDNAPFVSAELGLGDAGIEVMKVIDSFGQTTWLVLSGIRVNRELDPELFSFTPPEGADVMGLKESNAKGQKTPKDSAR
uniref:Outer-membrane lipoprotein carrier protein n=1 Tax=Candidatus Kentrum sp. DK TaxID=2126562 RepID=A0A450SBG4_9GAMM|nr:MAG: outer membrane lipoprotein carrier protein [Candidatus Kentron sp. DK]